METLATPKKVELETQVDDHDYEWATKIIHEEKVQDSM